MPKKTDRDPECPRAATVHANDMNAMTSQDDLRTMMSAATDLAARKLDAAVTCPDDVVPAMCKVRDEIYVALRAASNLDEKSASNTAIGIVVKAVEKLGVAWAPSLRSWSRSRRIGEFMSDRMIAIA